MVCSGDFLIWHFPNADNPQKVQRYPDRWARALREMIARSLELLVPAHGLPIEGRSASPRSSTRSSAPSSGWWPTWSAP